MAARLVARGHTVRAYDVSADRLAQAVAAGARPALDPADAVSGANAVLLNLPTPAAVEQAVFGPDGVAQVMRPPQVLVDFSTIEVERCRAFAARLVARTGCAWIDAPVSGGPPASADGKLAVMAGGPADEMERLAPLFTDISSAFTHVGPTGAGLTAKMVSQLMVSCL
ncbi:MAG TPA: NAD(P)-dependent oxidoreductase, partial [Xanthobacteraceae bacterium]|nr:NAD(P)-dependent oxidoreductase [Xanthobacteraceae bacterium]